MTDQLMPPDDETLSVQQWIDQLETRLRALETASASQEARLNVALALFNDANSWAQHFSNVRLAVVTFLSGICLGIMNFKWDHPNGFLVWSTLGVWLLGLTLFVIFSMAEWSKLDQRERNLVDLMAAQGRTKRQTSTPPRTGVERITCEWRRQHDWAYAAYFVFTAIFLIAWCEWHDRTGRPRPKPHRPDAAATSNDPRDGDAPVTD